MGTRNPQRIIIDGLTYPEIVEVINTDVPAIHGEMKRRYLPYEREYKTMRTNGPVTFKPFEIKRPTGVNWFCRYFVLNRADFKKNSLLYVLYGYFYINGNINAVLALGMPHIDKYDRYAFYYGHFFERYRERYLKTDCPVTEAIHAYFKYNGTGWGNTAGPNGEVFATIPHGAALGIRENEILVYKTYIAPEQCFTEQEKARKRGLYMIERCTEVA